MTFFKRRFGDYLSMAEAKSEWDALEFDPSTQKLHEFLDILQKTAEEAFGTESLQFIEMTIYAKMPNHVKKRINRAYLEDKSYNDMVLHLDREMRLDSLGTPDEVTLVPLNTIEPAQPQTEVQQTGNRTQNTKKGYCFYCSKFGNFKAECRKTRRDKWQQTRENNVQANLGTSKTPKCDTFGKPHKRKDYWKGANDANDPRPKPHNHNQQDRKTDH